MDSHLIIFVGFSLLNFAKKEVQRPLSVVIVAAIVVLQFFLSIYTKPWPSWMSVSLYSRNDGVLTVDR